MNGISIIPMDVGIYAFVCVHMYMYGDRHLLI